jgi:hypothetical protein
MGREASVFDIESESERVSTPLDMSSVIFFSRLEIACTSRVVSLRAYVGMHMRVATNKACMQHAHTSWAGKEQLAQILA